MGKNWCKRKNIVPFVIMIFSTSPGGGGGGAMSSFGRSSSSQPYAIRSLSLPSLSKGDQNRAQVEVQRSYWWEVLCLVKSLPGDVINEVLSMLGRVELKV